ncbi:hypothetical protein OG244_24260 [Streptomyces brevispora]|uniref:hypothetical protein n=1 Tax=Streptomyces brevispora TaxID=887462 RepID=UPI002E3533E8|nr:hypothetical protein [Streptomyces brevispora]
MASLIVSNDHDPVSAPTPPPAASTGGSPRSGPTSRASPTQDPATNTSAPESPAGDSATPDSPAASASTDADLTSPAGYAPVRTAMWGLAPERCTQHEQQVVDLDDGTSRVETEHSGIVKEPRGAELVYWPDTCSGLSDYLLRALPNTRVGILRADMPKSFESCEAASGTGLGSLALAEKNVREERGFVEGAALCSVTDRGAVSMALIDHIAEGDRFDVSVSGALYVWPKSD